MKHYLLKSVSRLLFGVFVTTSMASMASGSAMPIGQLYQAYIDAGYSSTSLPQYGHPVTVEATVLEVSNNRSGNTLLRVSASTAVDEVARLLPADKRAEAKMQALKFGQTFVATCTLGLTSGSDYMSLKHCTLP